MDGSHGRREESRRIQRRPRRRIEVLFGFLFAVGVLAVGSHWFGVQFLDFHMNIFTEAAGIVATVLIVDRWYARGNTEREEQELHARLRRQARSGSHDIAIGAIEELRDRDLLSGEKRLLAGEDLYEAPLEKARLSGANLQGTILDHADLRNARLIKAKLQGATLTFAKLHNAKLNEAEMQDAKGHGAEMPDARLAGRLS